MLQRSVFALLIFAGGALACGDSSSGDTADASESGAGSDGAVGAGSDASTAKVDGGGATDAGGSADGGVGDASSSAGDGAAADTDGGASASTSLTGTLGSLGAVQATVSSLVTANSGETIVYLSSAPLTCADIQTSRWLGSLPKGSQVVELVIKGAPKPSTYKVGPAEVNYAPGGMSSAYEKSADSGSITFTEGAASSAVSGTISATYGSPKGDVSGSFHAEFCAGGQEY